MYKFYFLLFVLSLTFASCRNEEGEGGSSSVQGYVYKIIHSDNNYSLQTDTVPASKEDIYIIYGDDEFYGDDEKAGANGFFQFKYLREGDYKLFAYSSLSDGIKNAVTTSVHLGNHKTVVADTIFIHTGDAYGKSIVKGQIYVNYYHKGDLVAYAQAGVDQRVYICYHGENIPFDDVKAGLNGEFGFEKLKPGTYDIFVITENPDTEAQSSIKQTITVSHTDTIYTLPNTFTISVAV
ncbi:hypothetical protein [Parabacteroides sp. FAFU027]|uniref:hypothetical protein n=1 Tax=Parabacteroides sp. FAFU027 TaxID=2922715 RepID=UPI001FAF4B22|nr:hypothetical protein [Parabacteroides sp. FAFU027]